ncbi:unnamed protein product, partial [Rotaria sp. Silwood1]
IFHGASMNSFRCFSFAFIGSYGSELTIDEMDKSQENDAICDPFVNNGTFLLC